MKEKIVDVVSKLDSNINDGLNSNQVEEAFKIYGKNEFEEENKITIFEKVICHLK